MQRGSQTFRGTDQENSTSHSIKELTVCADLVLLTEFQFLLRMKKIMTYFCFAHSQKEKNETRIGQVYTNTSGTYMRPTASFVNARALK